MVLWPSGYTVTDFDSIIVVSYPCLIFPIWKRMVLADLNLPGLFSFSCHKPIHPSTKQSSLPPFSMQLLTYIE